MNNIQVKACDWRAALAQNQRKTFFVISLFILIYLAVGFLVDLYIHGAFMQNQFSLIFMRLISFQAMPAVTLIMGGVALISLLITFKMYDRLMLLGTEYYEITPKSARNLQETQLYNIVEELKLAAGLRYMPKVYLIEAPYMNAFASGYSEKSAMIAMTRGLLEKLNREELSGVIGHELSHIRHGDIKLTLAASVLSNIMLLVIDLFFYDALFSRNSREEGGNGFLAIIIILRYLLPAVTILLLLYLSRTREYMADAGSVELLRDNSPIAKALLKICDDHESNKALYSQAYGQTRHEDVRRASYIFDPFSAGIHPIQSLTSLVSTHPSLKDRLKALGFNAGRDV